MSTKTMTKSEAKDATQTRELDVGGHVKIQQLFKLMVESGASDLHVTVGSPPGMRVNGEIVR